MDSTRSHRPQKAQKRPRSIDYASATQLAKYARSRAACVRWLLMEQRAWEYRRRECVCSDFGGALDVIFSQKEKVGGPKSFHLLAYQILDRQSSAPTGGRRQACGTVKFGIKCSLSELEAFFRCEFSVRAEHRIKQLVARGVSLRLDM